VESAVRSPSPPKTYSYVQEENSGSLRKFVENYLFISYITYQPSCTTYTGGAWDGWWNLSKRAENGDAFLTQGKKSSRYVLYHKVLLVLVWAIPPPILSVVFSDKTSIREDPDSHVGIRTILPFSSLTNYREHDTSRPPAPAHPIIRRPRDKLLLVHSFFCQVVAYGLVVGYFHAWSSAAHDVCARVDA
jgi:hypothetical protein